jgi:hypothetical protein
VRVRRPVVLGTSSIALLALGVDELRDVVPQALFDAALWRSVYGESATPPEPGPGASLAEHERAVELELAWRRGADVAKWARTHPRPAD